MTDWRAKLEARWPGVRFEPIDSLSDELVGEDVLLAKAALADDARALSYLDAIVISEVRRAVTPLDSSGALVDEVTQLVRERLLVAPARLNDYAGQGTLSAWVRAMSVRLALNARRPGAREDAVGEVPDAPVVDPDPELALLRARYRDSFREAFSAAVATLTPRDRTILRMSSIDGLPLKVIGKMYGKDASTISRWLAASREALLSHTRKSLGEQLSLTPSSLDSLMRAADSELNLSISRLLESADDSVQGPA